MDGFWGQILAFFVAFIPGVLIALIADYLSRRRQVERERRVNENARTLLAPEVGANLNAHRDFWQTVNGLDTEPQRDGLEAHLAAMAQNGLLGYTAPRWSVARWSGARWSVWRRRRRARWTSATSSRSPMSMRGCRRLATSTARY